jgi:transcriptional regulator with XRE-family HTH domain
LNEGVDIAHVRETDRMLGELLAAKLTLREIASLFGVSARTVSNWLNGTPVRDRQAERIELAVTLLKTYTDGEMTRERMMTPSVVESSQDMISPWRATMRQTRPKTPDQGHPLTGWDDL